MARPANRSFTVADLYRLPDDDRRYELAHGLLVSEPPPGGLHGDIAANMVYELESYTRKSGEGVVFTCDTGYVLARDPDTVRAPDISYMSSERYAEVVDKTRLTPGPPDLAVEVLSPRDRRTQWRAKVADYLDYGTPVVWVCDPRARTVVCFAAGEEATLKINGVLEAPDILPGFSLALLNLFGRELN